IWLAFPLRTRYVAGMSKAKNTRPRDKGASKKTSSYHHGALQTALIRAAREILESKGYEALTLRAAARRAGVSQAAPYNHFSDKAALLAAIAAQGFKEFAVAMRQEVDAAVDPEARLNAAGIAYVAFATSNPGLFKLMFGSNVHQSSGDPDLDAARTSAYEVLRGAVHAVRVSGPGHPAPEELESLRSWALVHGLATMINEGTIAPGVYGASSSRELAAALLGSPQMEKTSSASSAAKKCK
ncbi:MAG TPA: TetR/AcrR family transcriptional regulator, partial [Steroidobacteraceae bacterium]|nr:TetR/AcrR family transcriptional regulator [Steroidobacteraceae bacterium]